MSNCDMNNVDAMMQAVTKVNQYLISNHLVTVEDNPSENIKGEVECPFCKQTLKYWQSSLNGHKGFTCGCIGNGTYQE